MCLCLRVYLCVVQVRAATSITCKLKWCPVTQSTAESTEPRHCCSTPAPWLRGQTSKWCLGTLAWRLTAWNCMVTVDISKERFPQRSKIQPREPFILSDPFNFWLYSVSALSAQSTPTIPEVSATSRWSSRSPILQGAGANMQRRSCRMQWQMLPLKGRPVLWQFPDLKKLNTSCLNHKTLTAEDLNLYTRSWDSGSIPDVKEMSAASGVRLTWMFLPDLKLLQGTCCFAPNIHAYAIL